MCGIFTYTLMLFLKASSHVLRRLVQRRSLAQIACDRAAFLTITWLNKFYMHSGSIPCPVMAFFVQEGWVIDDLSTWASQAAEPLNADDDRMISASVPLIPLGQSAAASRPGTGSERASCAGGDVTCSEVTDRPCQPSMHMLPPRPATPAEASVRSFLRDPEALSHMDVGGEVSSDDGSGDDGDIPEVLQVQQAQHTAWSRLSAAGSQIWGGVTSSQGAIGSRPATCRGVRNRMDGPLMSARAGGGGWGGRGSGLRPQTAHAAPRVALSAREKLERRQGYKAPKPEMDDVNIFHRAAQARFRF